MKFDTKQEGLETLFKPYQALLLEWLWELNETQRKGVTSGQAHVYLQNTTEKKSRASVIFFLNDLVEEGILTYEERTGKGGHHRVYYPNMNKEEFSAYVIGSINDKLSSVFPKSNKIKAKVTV
jgi:predicted transcriptional regulator